MKQLDLDLNMTEDRSAPMEMPAPEHYPTFHYEGPEELGIPGHGTMLVHYRLKREVETKLPREWYECDVEVRKILSAEEEKDMRPSKRDTSAEDSLDKLMQEKVNEPDSDGGRS